MDFDCKECVKRGQNRQESVEKRRRRVVARYGESPEFRKKKLESEADRYRRNAEKIKGGVREWRRALKKEVFSHYSSGVPRCLLCGEKDLRFLCLDHVNGDGADHRRKNPSMKGNPYLWARRNGFPPIFRVLCHNCNVLEHHIPGVSDSAAGKLRRKERILSHYSEGIMRCALCPTTDVRILTIDHMEGNGNAHRKSVKVASGSAFYKWIEESGFPLGFRVLCFNHNLGIHCLGD